MLALAPAQPQPLQAAKGSKAWTFLLLLRPSSTVCVPSFKSFKFSSCPCTSTATAGRHPPPLGQKHELFYCCCCCSSVSLRPSSTVFKLFQVIQIFFLPFHQHSHCRQAPTTTGSKAWTFLLLQLACCLTQAKQHCVPFNFHSNFLALALAPAQAKQHCVPFNFHSNFLACPCTSSGQAALPFHSAGPSRHFPSFKHQRGQQALIHSLHLSPRPNSTHFISQLLKFPTTKGGNRLWFTLWLSPRPSSTISSFNFWNLFPSWIFWARRVEMYNGSFVWILYGPKITPHIFQMEDPKNIEFFSKFWYKIREAKIAPCHLTTTNQTFLKSVGMDKMIWKGFRPLRPSRSKLLAFEFYEAKISLFTTSAKNWTRNVQNFKTNHKIAEVERSRGNKDPKTVSRSRPNWRNGSPVNF